MLASRGWAYTSELEAGGAGHRYHSLCDCEIVPEFDAQAAHMDGYNPDAMYAEYSVSKMAAEADGLASDDKAIAEMMRELFPDKYTDGHTGTIKGASADGTLSAQHYAEYRRRLARRLADMPEAEREGKRIPPAKLPEAPGPDIWPSDLPKLTAKYLRHIFYGDGNGGGHLAGYGWIKGGTEFDFAQDANKVLEVMAHIVRKATPTESWAGISGAVEVAYSGEVYKVVVYDNVLTTLYRLER